jgi:hypothetical protein
MPQNNLTLIADELSAIAERREMIQRAVSDMPIDHPSREALDRSLMAYLVASAQLKLMAVSASTGQRVPMMPLKRTP